MKAESLLTALDLPIGCCVDQRVPKKLLVEHGTPTAPDKRYINDGIEELYWLAALKPTTIGVPEYRDTAREYLEIAVLRLALRPDAKLKRLVELVHRAIPYPVLLLTEQEGRTALSCGHIRWAQNEADKMVLDGEIIAVLFDKSSTNDHDTAFCESLALGRQPRSTLYTLYQGWIGTLVALKAARLTGQYKSAINDRQTAIRHQALQECARLNAEIARLRAAAQKEKQMSRQVELNLNINRLQSDLKANIEKL